MNIRIAPPSKVWAASISTDATLRISGVMPDEAGRNRSAGPGAPGKYDWEGFHMALFKRIYTGGFPAQQRDLVFEMQEWFIANSADGEAPDESTIRRRIKAIWQELNPV